MYIYQRNELKTKPRTKQNRVTITFVNYIIIIDTQTSIMIHNHIDIIRTTYIPKCHNIKRIIKTKST